jgi:hypothetical protein
MNPYFLPPVAVNTDGTGRARRIVVQPGTAASRLPRVYRPAYHRSGLSLPPLSSTSRARRRIAGVSLNAAVVFVQERLPTAPPRRLTPARIEAIVEINDRFAGALAPRPDVPAPPLCLARGSGSSPRHDDLEAHSQRTRRVLDEIHRIGQRGPREIGGTDLVRTSISLRRMFSSMRTTALRALSTGILVHTVAIDSSPSSKPGLTESGSSGHLTPTR